MSDTTIKQAGQIVEHELRRAIREHAKLRGWTIRQVATAAGIPPATLYPWVRSERGLQSRALCRVLALLAA